MEEEGKELVDACRDKKWERAKTMISKNPRLAYTDMDSNGLTPMHWAAYHDNVDFLQHMLDAILLLSLQQHHHQHQEGEEERLRQDAFERVNNHGFAPAHSAARNGSVNCFAFLVEHATSRNEPRSFSSSGLEIPDRSSSGATVLEVKDRHGRTPLHYAAACGKMDAFDFILRNAPSRLSSGLQIHARSSQSTLLPLPFSNSGSYVYGSSLSHP
jgi:ankyrin repeat protein